MDYFWYVLDYDIYLWSYGQMVLHEISNALELFKTLIIIIDT